MKYKNIPDLYLIKGKLVFRKHVTFNGQEFNIWKTIGRPEDYTEDELKKITVRLRKQLYEKYMNPSRETSRDLTTRNFPVKRLKLKTKTRSSKNLEKLSLEDFTLKNSGREKNLTFGKTNSVFKKFVSEKKMVKPVKKSPTLGEILKRFFVWYRAVRKSSTCEVEIRRARNLLRHFGEDFPFLEIGMKEVEEYKVKRLNEGTNPSTVNKDLRLLSTVINRAVEFEWIPQHRLYRKPLLTKGIKNERIRYLTEDEEKRLMQALNQSKSKVLKDVVLFALHTGMRLGEILDLKWENINFENKVIILLPEQTKSRRRHILPLNDVALEVLKRRFECRVSGCPYVFHRQGKKVKSVKEAFKNALKRAGIENFRFHDLRHTFASRLVQKNVDLYVVKELLNHSDIRTTQRYAHLKLDNLKKAVEVLRMQE